MCKSGIILVFLILRICVYRVYESNYLKVKMTFNLLIVKFFFAFLLFEIYNGENIFYINRKMMVTKIHKPKFKVTWIINF